MGAVQIVANENNVNGLSR